MQTEVNLTVLTEEQHSTGGWPPSWLMGVPALARFYRKYEKHIPLMVFATGFLWDTLTMVRVDNVLDHMILLTYLAALAVMICYTIRRQCGYSRPAWIRKLEPYFLWAMQFVQGGLFSSFVIFYFMSVSWTRTLAFFAILLLLLIGNEFLRHRLLNPRLLAVLYTFCLFSFLAFFVPTILARVDHSTFLYAGAFSLLVSTSVFFLGYFRREQWFNRQILPSLLGIGATIVAVNLLYIADLIPPVPLALKTAAIFHQVAKTPSGYQVSYVKPPVYRFWEQSDEPFYLSTGESAFCYTAIFAPANIRVPVRHVWSIWKPSIGWSVTDRIPFAISGGREGGYRGYTRKGAIQPGQWRVEVQTYHNRTLGRIGFKVVPSPDPHPPLVTRTIP
jgi:hypothetical protein